MTARWKYIEALLCAIVIWAFMGPHAQADELYLGGWSHHFISQDVTSETHNLVAYRSDYGYMAGYFNNSYGDDTVFAAVSKDIWEYGHWDADLHYGAMVGYDECVLTGRDDPVCPMILPEIAYTKYRVKPALALMGDALAFTVRIEF